MKKYFYIIFCLTFIAFNTKAQTTSSLDEAANNSTGVYAPMDLGYAGFNSLGMTQAAWLDPLQNLGEGQSKPAYSKYYWSEDLVLPIRLREAMVTLVNFPEWEMIESIQFGNIEAFSGQIVGPNTVLLWSKGNVGVDTNVIMFGRSGNKYVFYLKSEGVDTERLTNAIIDIEIPQDNVEGAGGSGGFFNNSSSSFSSGGGVGGTQTATRRFQREDWLKSIPFNPDELKFDMEVYVPNPADVVIAPERVWRDDVFTYIDLGEKALTMVQRPIVTQIVERSEMPVGFRTKGPNNRLIVVEGVGDFVLRNGKRIICLKLRKDDARGINDYTSAEDDPRFQNQWDVPAPLPDFNKTQKGSQNNSQNQGDSFVGFGNGFQNSQLQNGSGEFLSGATGFEGGLSSGYGEDSFGYKTGQSYGANSGQGRSKSGYAIIEEFSSTSFAADPMSGNISVQLGTGDDITKLEDLWLNLSSKYADVLTGYEPFFSVDAPADGKGRELYHLRLSPVSTLQEGDEICSNLGRRGVFCSVVRTQ